MDMLANLRTFIRISETGSFSAVAREVGSTQPAVSRQIAALEEHLGARLFQRSTRSLTLTEDGRDLLVHARLVVEAVEETEAAIGRRRTSPSGQVRLGCPGVFGRLYVAPRIARLLERYPDLSIDLSMSDTVVDMVQDGLDLSIRVGEVTDASLVARRIGSTSALTVASPDYLARHGEPATPEDLRGHACILFTRLAAPDVWNFVGADGPVAVPVTGRMRTNDIDAVAEAAMSGVGVALLPTWVMRGEAMRRLKPILPAWQPRRRAISVVYPSRRFLAPRTRAVIDFLVDEFRLDPMVSAYGEA
jgi:DNA-binding transcriptional LysR family regulator